MKSIINKITIILILVLLLLMLTSSSYAIGDMMNAASNFLEKGEEPENDGLNMASFARCITKNIYDFFYNRYSNSDISWSNFRNKNYGRNSRGKS